MPLRALPTELKYVVSHHLCGDTTTLSALSLVSTQWLKPSQVALFYQLSIEVGPSRSLDHLISFFSENTHLAACTTQLVIGGQPIIDIGGLHYLRLSALPLFGPGDVDHVLPHPCTFCLSSVNVQNPRTLEALCVRLTGHTLMLADVDVETSDEGFNSTPSSSFQDLRVLDISHSRATPDALVEITWPEWMLRGHVEHLCLRLDESDFAEDHTAQHLIHDLVGPGGFGGTPDDWDDELLHDKCPRLKSLTLAMSTDNQYKMGDTIMQWRYALRLLSSCPRSITHIFIELDDAGTRDGSIPLTTARYVAWNKWEEVLGRFERLESFRIMNPGARWSKGHEDFRNANPGNITSSFESHWEAYVRERFASSRLLAMEHFAN
ncbi:hypothetical protein EIP91_000866 [Steccherinum ochraceum]|uniref:F-box domain-containing protein n=1 Tax=Steccherinum ochraceum TaxID=92696 RepID=A0A4R0RXW1_9APHY|nr:hypothetical protein EIP91_000866 [Steccherinum ochraceum]